MKVIVPDILAASRLVVLPGADARTAVGCFHGEGCPASKRVDMRAKHVGQSVKMFVMVNGYDQDVARCPGPLLGGHKDQRLLIPVDKIFWLRQDRVAHSACSEETKRAPVSMRRMGNILRQHGSVY